MEEYKRIRDIILSPPTALSIAVPRNKIFRADIEQSALRVINVINEKCYTHVPITESGRFVGIFSENTIFSYLTSNEGIILEEDASIGEFYEYLPVDKHSSESFLFIPKSKYVFEVAVLFQNYLAQIKRLSVVFITEHGNLEEELLGMITAWDIAGMMDNGNNV